MKVRFLSVAMLIALMSALLVVGGAGAKQHTNGSRPLASKQLRAKFGNATLNITRFAVNSAGSLVASGTVTNAANRQIGTFADAPVQVAQATCTILDLTLGPIHLNLLGLVIDTNQIHITITGQTGPGNLLGNLICGLLGGLGGTTPLAAQRQQ